MSDGENGGAIVALTTPRLLKLMVYNLGICICGEVYEDLAGNWVFIYLMSCMHSVVPQWHRLNLRQT